MKKYFLLFLILILSKTNYAQTLEGMNGLFFIPTADMQSDGNVTLGSIYLPKESISFGSGRYNAYVPFVTFNFLPFIEVSVKLTRLINFPGKQALGDRTPSIRARLFTEGEIYPAVVVGLHDLATAWGGTEAIHNNALYIVSSKHFSFNSFVSSSGIHLGYGVDWMRADTHHFVGLFGGASFTLFNTMEIMGEYDGTHSNTGIRINILNHFKILAGFLQLKYFSGGVAVNFKL